MPEWENFLQSLDRRQEPGSDFEERVFTKIRKKKKQRKIAYRATAAASVLLLLLLLQVFRPAARPSFQAGRQTPEPAKEEIPLQEDLIFSTSDTYTRYSLEPVSYQKKAENENPAINQI